MPTAPGSLQQPVVAGIVTALVGFTSSFAVVIAGLRAVGATNQQAASGLLALTVVFGVGIIVLCLRSKRRSRWPGRHRVRRCWPAWRAAITRAGARLWARF